MVEPVGSATVRKFEYTKSEVSSPSRRTAKKAAPASAIGPVEIAFSTLLSNSPLRLWAARFIQKTIQVTNPTAIREVVPAKYSWPRSLNETEVKVRNAPNVRLRAIAPATPSHNGLR